MKIAIQASDLDHSRIDGTRVYLFNLLKNFGKIDNANVFSIWHKTKFNPSLVPSIFPNYEIHQTSFPVAWTQTRFALEIWREKPDLLWMPMQAIPIFKRKGLKTIVTIHDLAFKYFPEHFPKSDLIKLNIFSKLAIERSDKIIAVSHSTKNDILKFFPKISEKKIKVIHHGIDTMLFQKKIPEESRKEILTKYQLQTKNHILYIGAIQPRKNIATLVHAFELFKKQKESNVKLVIGGEIGWLEKETLEAIENSSQKKDIILTGKIDFVTVSGLMHNAGVFVFPSLYEGFGLPIIEAMAAGIPVIAADNSSLLEVGGRAALYFKASDFSELAQKISLVLENKNISDEMIQKGLERAKLFSWEKCAQETLELFRQTMSE